MKKKIGYKVVELSAWTGHFISATKSGKVYRYYCNKRAYRYLGDGPLAVFNTLEAANKFMLSQESKYHPCNLQIFKCEYRPTQKGIDTLWYCERNNSISFQLFQMKFLSLPPQTRLAEWVKLIERVDDLDYDQNI